MHSHLKPLVVFKTTTQIPPVMAVSNNNSIGNPHVNGFNPLNERIETSDSIVDVKHMENGYIKSYDSTGRNLDVMAVDGGGGASETFTLVAGILFIISFICWILLRIFKRRSHIRKAFGVLYMDDELVVPEVVVDPEVVVAPALEAPQVMAPEPIQVPQSSGHVQLSSSSSNSNRIRPVPLKSPQSHYTSYIKRTRCESHDNN